MFGLVCLQVRTLQLEMEYAYGSLEDEARDVIGDSKGSDLKLALSRRGSSDEVALLVAGEAGESLMHRRQVQEGSSADLLPLPLGLLPQPLMLACSGAAAALSALLCRCCQSCGRCCWLPHGPAAPPAQLPCSRCCPPAEFRLLDEQLGAMAAAVEAEEALFIDDRYGPEQGCRCCCCCWSTAGLPSADAAPRSHDPPPLQTVPSTYTLCPTFDDSELARLATDIPDLRLRLGIGEAQVGTLRCCKGRMPAGMVPCRMSLCCTAFLPQPLECRWPEVPGRVLLGRHLGWVPRHGTCPALAAVYFLSKCPPASPLRCRCLAARASRWSSCSCRWALAGLREGGA